MQFGLDFLIYDERILLIRIYIFKDFFIIRPGRYFGKLYRRGNAFIYSFINRINFFLGCDFLRKNGIQDMLNMISLLVFFYFFLGPVFLWIGNRMTLIPIGFDFQQSRPP